MFQLPESAIDMEVSPGGRNSACVAHCSICPAIKSNLPIPTSCFCIKVFLLCCIQGVQAYLTDNEELLIVS